MTDFNELHELELAIYFSSQMNKDREEQREEEIIEENSDWGDVDPAGGPAPSAPGSAV